MPPPPSTWKSIERGFCHFMGWVRTHWALEDGYGDGYQCEIKHGKQCGKWILKSWAQAVKNAPKGEPCLYIHPPRWPIPDGLVVIRALHFKELVGVKRNGNS